MTYTSLKLIDLYKLHDMSLNSDEAVQNCVNKIIEEKNKKIIEMSLCS